ncbi:hypothetical protein BSKO_12750 [Bryopsis sp. KO-2023]|nr:hypothetical protein BSKO_12750 [Bryopsis sp. KO-2023]
MGAEYSVEDAGDCVDQTKNPLVVFGKTHLADGKRVFVVRADKSKNGKSASENKSKLKSWLIQDTHGANCFKVDYRFKFTQRLLDAKGGIIAILDKRIDTAFYTKRVFNGDSLEEEDLAIEACRRISHYRAEMCVKIYDHTENRKGKKGKVLESLRVLGNKKEKTFVVLRNDVVIGKSYRMDRFNIVKGSEAHNKCQDTYYLEVASGVDTVLIISLAAAMNRFMKKK